MSPENHSIRLPRSEGSVGSHPFPILATIAPVIASVALYIFTGSPFALMFAALGPIVAVASLGDARRQARRHRRQESARYQIELEHARQEILNAQERETARREGLAPSASALLMGHLDVGERWTRRIDEFLPVTLGRGPVVIDLITEHELHEVREESELVTLGTEANMIARASVLVDARLGIAVIGPSAQVLAMLNGIAIQLADALAPEEVGIVVGNNPALDWLESLPHTQMCRISGSRDTVVEFRHRDSLHTITIAAVTQLEDVPRSCRVVIRIGGGDSARVIRHPDQDSRGPIDPEFVSSAQARTFALALAVAARAHGLVAAEAMPSRVGFGELDHTVGPAVGSLSCALGFGEHGPVVIDLVSDGPHAVIGGTTGSGKSELLISWVLGIATKFPPTTVTFLLVDFKGGASFSAVAGLPHCLGVVTDLDETGAKRALASLTAEIRRRERVLADNAATSIDALHDSVSLPRLVIVVDEFATVTTSFPELHELFADIAARGRSLGIHLILCTQRPAGVVRDAVLANCALRISLRVNNPADSVAVIGSPDAAELSRKDPGRAILTTGDGAPIVVQIAQVTPADAEAVAVQWASQAAKTPVWRPWCEPLAPTILVADLGQFGDGVKDPGIAFGVLDRPASQSQDVARFDPEVHGSMLIVGGRRSGKSSALAAIAAQSPTLQFPVGQFQVGLIPPDVEIAWDTVADALDGVRTGSRSNQLFLIDDIDVILGRLGNDYSIAMVERLVALVREGSACGVHVVLSASRISGQLQALAEVCESRVVLRVADLQDYLVAGGQRESFDPTLPPGGGVWRGDRIQILSVTAAGNPRQSQTRELVVPSQLAVISRTPLAISSRLEMLGTVTLLGGDRRTDRLDILAETRANRTIFLGDPEAWQAEWALLASLRASAPLAFHGCSPSQFQSIARVSLLPPPLLAPAKTMVLLAPDGRLSRVALPNG